MENVIIITRQLLIMFIYMLVGAFMFKKNLITREGSRTLANILVYLCLPCVLLNSFATEYTAEKASALVVSLGIGALATVISIGLSVLLIKDRMDAFGSMVPNAGFMGLPLVSALLGTEAVLYVAAYIAILNGFQATYGRAYVSGRKELFTPKAIASNPIIIAFAASLALFFLRIPLPSILKTPVSAIASMNAPLAMLIIGVYLAQADIKSMFTEPSLYKTMAVRHLLIPAVTLLAFRLIPDRYAAIRTTIAVCAACPVGSNLAVYAQQLDLDYTYAVKVVVLSTLLSLVTLPAVMFFV